MKELTYQRSKILGILKDNREAHEQEHGEAMDAYYSEAREKLVDMLDAAHAGTPFDQFLGLSVPEEHLDEYDTAIRMFELCQEDIIELTHADFHSYIMDHWSWSDRFKATNAVYTR